MFVRDLIQEIRTTRPLIHHLTNYVTVNDCANIVLAIGGSPVMSDAEEEVAEMVTLASSLVINIGTLNRRKVLSMFQAGEAAKKHNIPIVFDPTGVGATSYRNDIAKEIIKEIRPTVIKGNASEILALLGIKSKGKGVDACTGTSMNTLIAGTKQLSELTDAIIVTTGAIDIISNGKQTILVKNGVRAMSLVTGTGCMCSSLIGTFCGVAQQDILSATAMAVIIMGISGELAWDKEGSRGLGHFHMGIIDAIGEMNHDILKKYGRWDKI